MARVRRLSAQDEKERHFRYDITPGSVLERFHLAANDQDVLYRGIMGPVRSGKSTAMSCEIMRLACQTQAPGPDGIRHSRWAVVRNTYRELNDTTLKTWLMWFPDGSRFGNFNRSDFSYTGRVHNKIWGTSEYEVLFRALDTPDDVKKLLSLELTGAWVNEAREIPRSIIDTLGDRVGQFPSKKDGGATWRGVFMDTNPPDDDHWWYKLAEEERPSTYRFFRQPGGLIETGLDAHGNPMFAPNPLAENIQNLEPDYYLTRAQGKDPNYVRVYYCAQYGFSFDGKPVIPEYRDDVHCAKHVLEANPLLPISMGVDFGLTPAIVFGQRYPSGRWTFLHELVTEDMGIQRATELLCKEINDRFRGFTFCDGSGDPAGEARAQTDESTPFQIMNSVLESNGFKIRFYPAPSNDFVLRRGAVANLCGRLIDGYPGLLISPSCKTLRKGFNGGYCYRRLKVSGTERYVDKPDKNRYSHPCEAAQYMLLGAGEGLSLIHGQRHLEEEEEMKYVTETQTGRSQVCGY